MDGQSDQQMDKSSKLQFRGDNQFHGAHLCIICMPFMIQMAHDHGDASRFTYHTQGPLLVLSDVGPQHCCRWIGRGMQPPSTPSSTPCSLTHADNHNCSIINARYYTFQLNHHGPTDGQMDGLLREILVSLRVDTGNFFSCRSL